MFDGIKEMFKILMEKMDNDTLIVLGLLAIAFTYAIKQPPSGTQIVSNIVSIFGGYIGGQYVSTKNQLNQ